MSKKVTIVLLTLIALLLSIYPIFSIIFECEFTTALNDKLPHFLLWGPLMALGLSAVIIVRIKKLKLVKWLKILTISVSIVSILFSSLWLLVIYLFMYIILPGASH